MDIKESKLSNTRKCPDRNNTEGSPQDQEDNKGSPKKYYTSSQRRRQQRKKAAQFKNQRVNNEPQSESDTLLNNDTNLGPANNIIEPIRKREHTVYVDEQRAFENSSPQYKNKLKSVDIILSESSCVESKGKGNSKDTTMEGNQLNKSRDEVKAAREEKKKLKQLAKTESKNKTESKVKTENLSQDVKISPNNVVSNVSNKEITVDVKEATKVCNKRQNESLDTSVNKSIINNNEDGVSNADTSRDKIKAEREAKKLAKQMAKNKSKTKQDDVAAVEEKLSNMTVNSSNESNKKTETNDALDTSSMVDKQNQQEIKVDQESKESEKSKAALKAERRAKQEAQRAAKAVLQSVKTPKTEEKKKQEVKHLDKPIQQIIATELKKSQSPEKSKMKNQEQHKVKLFDHLYVQRETDYLESPIPLNSKEIHPAIVRLGVQYANHIVMGSNARCIALLNALKQVIVDYTLPPNVEFSRGLEAHLKPCIKFLDSCRLPAVSMKNALKHITWQLRHLPNNIAEYEAKMKLYDAIDTYARESIEMARQAISIAVRKKISDGDVILTYGCSSLIEKIITEAAHAKRFRVVIVTAHPWNEGRELLRRLTAKGVKCSLIMISALSFVMREINKVLLGAGALLANGYVMARAGTAQVAMVAHAHNVPVLVCCETHKFSERVQTDSIVYNEIGNPDDLINCDPSHKDSPLANWRSNNSLTLLNLTYDVTPPDLVTAVVTELAILPCTSVPVILRMKPSEFSV